MENSFNNPYNINRHGFISTPQLTTYGGDWLPYVKNRINEYMSVNNISRMTISEFLSTPHFLESQINNSTRAETPRIEDKFLDPLPRYDGIEVRTGGLANTAYPKNGLRRSKDYLNGLKRREWGFREKILQGYPEYKPFFPYQSKIIIGIVTVGSGVFDGIPASSDIQLTKQESFRSTEIGGIPRNHETTPVPTGLCFIQDETGALGIATGTDVSHVYNPSLYKTNHIHSSLLLADDMHMGSIVVPKADYRNFLRVGDLVVIEIGTNFKYWHAVLGSEPKNWEELWAPRMLRVHRRTETQLYGTRYPSDYMDIPGLENSEAALRWDWKKENRIDLNTNKNIELYTNNVSGSAVISLAKLRDKRYLGDNRRPYVDNWGGYQNPIANLQEWQVSDAFGSAILMGWISFLRKFNPYKFVLPDYIGRDVPPRGNWNGNRYSLYPIQNDHPWSTGTPIPVNTGMPYIMMEEFIVDETERFSPTPLVITNSQLRGFPTISDPRRLGEIDSNLAWKKDSSEDQSKNPWIQNKGSDYKGMLVQLKNVRFVLPPLKNQLQVRSAVLDETMRASGDGRWGSVETLKKDFDYIVSQLKDGNSIEDIEINIRGVDYSGLPSVGHLQLLQFIKNGIDGKGFEIDTGLEGLQEWVENDWDTVVGILKSISLSVVDYIVGLPQGTSETVFDFTSALFDSPTEWWDEADGDQNSYYKYEFVSLPSPFPKSVDKEDGGYWWANPDIPLTNARSHYRDYQLTTVGQTDYRRDHFTQLVSSNKLPEIADRYVRDLGASYSSSYAPFAEEWKPSTKIGGMLLMNSFKSVPPGEYFEANKTYYVADEHNVVVPIRINSSTEIARYELPIPTGSVDITGIAWQYSLGKPGLEWEREAYIMQVWPRFASDIAKRTSTAKKEEVDGGKKKEDTQQKKSIITRLSDREFDLSEAKDLTVSQINTVNCDWISNYFKAFNNAIKLNISRYERALAENWPIIETYLDIDGTRREVRKNPNGNTTVHTHHDKQRQVQYLEELNNSLLPCESLKPNQEIYIVFKSDIWYGLTRTFYFRTDENGNCTCKPVPTGTNKPMGV